MAVHGLVGPQEQVDHAPEVDLEGPVHSCSPLGFRRSPYRPPPTLSVPCGLSRDGLPLSLQFVGKHLGEPLLCRIGHAYEQATEWHTLRPPV